MGWVGDQGLRRRIDDGGGEGLGERSRMIGTSGCDTHFRPVTFGIETPYYPNTRPTDRVPV
jgi:hypothetical protein